LTVDGDLQKGFVPDAVNMAKSVVVTEEREVKPKRLLEGCFSAA
jgi:hypothetical protein